MIARLLSCCRQRPYLQIHSVGKNTYSETCIIRLTFCCTGKGKFSPVQGSWDMRSKSLYFGTKLLRDLWAISTHLHKASHSILSQKCISVSPTCSAEEEDLLSWWDILQIHSSSRLMTLREATAAISEVSIYLASEDSIVKTQWGF